MSQLSYSCISWRFDYSHRSAAHIALTRLPASLSSQALAQSLLKVVASIEYRNYPLVYKSAEELLDLAKRNLFDASLAGLIKLLVERHLRKPEIHANPQQAYKSLS